MRLVILFIAMVFFFSCKEKEEIYSIHLTEGVGLSASIINETSGLIALKMQITSESDRTIEIDGKAFVSECYYEKDNTHLIKFLTNKELDINKLSKIFQYSQVLIENETHDLKLLSVESFFGDTTKSLPLTNCMGDWLIKKSVVRNGSTEFILDHLQLNDFKIAPNDRKIRIYYLHKLPNLSEPVLKLRSNWFKL